MDQSPVAQTKKGKVMEEKQEETMPSIFKNREVFNSFKLMTSELSEENDNTEYINRINSEYEIKKEGLTFDILKEKFSILEKDEYIESDEFNDIFEFIVKSSNLFEEYSSRLGLLLSISIDEMNTIENNTDYDIDEEENDKNIELELEKYTGPYFNNIFKKYESFSFSERIKIISFLISFSLSAIFNNISFSKEKISIFFSNILEKENSDNGNHYISLYLNGIKESNKLQSINKISPNQFVVEKWVQNESNQSIGKDQMFISDPKDFESISILDEQLSKKFSRDIYDKYSDYCKKPLNNEDVVVNNFTSKDNYFDINFFRNKSIRDVFKKKTGFNLEDNTLPEQFNYFEYTKEITNKEADKFYSFINKFKKDGFRTFLSIEQGGKEMGDKILTLGDGEKLPEEIAKKVFEKYGEIIDSADKVEKEIKNIYKDEVIPVSVYGSTKETLLKEGMQLLLKYAEEAGSDQKIDGEKILQELEDVKTNTIILGSSYIELYKEGIRVPIEDLTKRERISSLNLTDKEKEELLKVYVNGRPKSTYENPEHIKLLKEEFEEELNNKDTEIINIRFNGDIIIFAIADKKGQDDLYIGGLTFVDEVRNPAIAVSAMESILKEFNDFNIKALVDSKNPIMSMYLKRFGFKIVKKLNSPEELKENVGELYYEIERPKEIKEGKTIGDNNLEKAA